MEFQAPKTTNFGKELLTYDEIQKVFLVFEK
jgi:hypothetical protein